MPNEDVRPSPGRDMCSLGPALYQHRLLLLHEEVAEPGQTRGLIETVTQVWCLNPLIRKT